MADFLLHPCGRAARTLGVTLFMLTAITAVTVTAVAAQRATAPASLSAPANVRLYAQLLRAADQRTLDSAAIRTGLASNQPLLRRAAALTLAQLAPTHRSAAIPWLQSSARDSTRGNADVAAFGLGLAHDTASVPMLASIASLGGYAAPQAAWALGEIGSPARSAIARLLAAATPSTSSSSGHTRATTAPTTRALILAVAKLRPLDFNMVAPFVNSRNSSLRWAAAYAIARQRAPAGLRALLSAAHPDAAFRSELARELTAATAGNSLATAAFDRLRDLARDRDAHVRISALRSIGTYGERGRGLLLGAMHDPDANVRITAAQSIATAFGTDSAAWQSAWAADTGTKFRQSLVESSVAAGYPLAADSLWLASPDWRLRSAAVGAWSQSHDSVRARQIGLRAARDTDGRVRATAYQLLAGSDTAHRDSVVQAALRTALTDDRDSVARESLPGYKPPATDFRAARHPIEWYEDVVRRIAIPSAAGHEPRARISTVRGDIVVALHGSEAPLSVLNYVNLAARHVYDGVRFHRVVPAFVAQDGDPRGDGNGGPGYTIRDELNLLPYTRGAVGMALSGPDTGGSQYFLTLTAQPHLTGHYTVFGDVVSGLPAMDALVEGDVINNVQIQW